MPDSSRINDIAALIYERAAATDASPSGVSPSRSRGQKDRLRLVVGSNYIYLDELNHVFQDITSASSLDYFDEGDAALIRQAASSLSDARRAIRRLSSRKWLKKA